MNILAAYLKRWHQRADKVGSFLLEILFIAQRFFNMFAAILQVFMPMRWLYRPAIMNVVTRQIYFTGVQSLPWILVIALGTGVLTVYAIVDFSRRVQDLSLIGSLINGVLVQEMAPFLVAFFLLARSGVAVVTEVGNMQSRGEEDLLRSLGISPYEYLYMPRVLAFSLCGMILTFIFVVVSIWVGGLVTSWMNTLNFNAFLFEVQRGTDLKEILTMVLKGMFYPMLSCMILLDQGRLVERDPNQIPIRATYGVLGALLLILFLDIVWVIVWNL